MTRKTGRLFSFTALALGLILLCGCAAEKTNQTPFYAASNTLRFAHGDDYAQLQGMFDEAAAPQATEELFAALQASYTDTQSHATCHFAAMENGDVWLFRFAPADEGEAWRIAAVTRLSAEQADALKPLLWQDA